MPAGVFEQVLLALPPATYLLDASDSFGFKIQHTVDVVLPRLRQTGKPWFTEIAAKILLKKVSPNGKRLVELMAEAGCKGVYVGFENPFIAIGAKSMSVVEYEELIRIVHGFGLVVMGAFVLDATGKETVESIQRTVHWIIENHIDVVQYSLLALLPGSRDRRNALRDGLAIDVSPEHLDGAWPTKRHPNLSPRQRIKLLMWAYDETYSMANTARRLLRLSAANLGLRLKLAAGHKQIRRSLSDWHKQTSYDYWLATRELPS
jgi:hypothetical protein